MTRNTHDRYYDHHGYDDDVNILLSAATSSYGNDQDLHSVIADIDARLLALSSIGDIENRVAFGTATVSSGTTSALITHGAGYDPDPWDLVITPTNNPTNDPGWTWITNVGAVTFELNVRNDPGSDATFAWRINK